MARPEHYQQPSLDFQQSERTKPQPQTPAGTGQHGDAPVMPSIAADPEGLPRGLASHRLPNDFWQEFHLEWEFREEHGMAPVPPAEFADMRDRSDGLIEPENTVWPSERVPSPYERETTE